MPMSDRSHQDIHATDIAWSEARDAMIRFAIFSTDEKNPHAPGIILSKFDPGTRIPPHTHGSNYFEYIIEGGQTVGKKWYGKGDIRIVRAGTGYGPLVIGPEGCTALIVFEDGSGSMTNLPPRSNCHPNRRLAERRSAIIANHLTLAGHGDFICQLIIYNYCQKPNDSAPQFGTPLGPNR